MSLKERATAAADVAAAAYKRAEQIREEEERQECLKQTRAFLLHAGFVEDKDPGVSLVDQAHALPVHGSLVIVDGVGFSYIWRSDDRDPYFVYLPCERGHWRVVGTLPRANSQSAQGHLADLGRILQSEKTRLRCPYCAEGDGEE